MRHKKGFIIPLTLVITLAISATIGALVYLNTVNLSNLTYKEEQIRARAIAEAGIYKAIWYLSNEPIAGGQGPKWRPVDYVESFGGGSYNISIVSDTEEEGLFIITVTGNYNGKSRVLQVQAGVSFGGGFADYAMHSDQAVGIDPNALIQGDIYADGYVTVETGSVVSQGSVYVTEGNQVTGEGTYAIGPTAEEDPAIIDYTYFYEFFAHIEAGGPDIIQGDQRFGDFDARNLTLYVNGTVTLEGQVRGPAIIVASKDIYVKSPADIDKRIELIAGDKMVIENLTVLDRNDLIYAGDQIIISNNLFNRQKIIVMTPNKLTIGANTDLQGIFFGNNIQVGDYTKIRGSLISGTLEQALDIGQGVELTYRNFFGKIPPGFDYRIRIVKWLKK